ncbi:MAG: protein-S-isoprenylcysteine O-methyltransferase [Pseudomonadota bacterium]
MDKAPASSDPASDNPSDASDLASDNDQDKAKGTIIGAQSSQLPLIPLLIFLASIAIYLWRSDFTPRWPMVIGALLILAQMAIRGPFAKNAGNVTVRRDYVYRFDLIVMFGVFITMAPLPVIRLATPWLDALDYDLGPIASAIGVAITLFGLWFFYRSHADLGKQWSATLQIGSDHQLITDGIYARIRHPMYTAIWLCVLGQPLLFQNWVVGPPVVVVWAILYFTRLPREEQMMEEHFGSAYQAYRQRAGALWPKIQR